MIKVADLTRKGFMNGDISTVMSPRTVLHWAENTSIFKDQGYAFRVTFLNKCDELEKKSFLNIIKDVLVIDLPESSINVSILKVEKKAEKLENFKTAIGSTIKSLSNSEKILKFFLANQNLETRKNYVKLPEIEQINNKINFKQIRALADSKSLKIRFSKEKLLNLLNQKVISQKTLQNC